MELIDYVRMVRRRWAWVLVFTLLGLGAGVAWSVLATKTYSATADVFVGSSFQGDGTDQSVAAQSASQFALDRMTSYAQLAGSSIVSAPVIRSEHLALTPSQFRSHVTVTAETKTVILKVTATDTKPRVAANLANATADQLASTIVTLEASGTKGTPPVNATVISRASVPSVPTSPNKKLGIGLGLVVGFGAGLLAASLREQSDRRNSPRLITPADVFAATGGPGPGSAGATMPVGTPGAGRP